MAESGEYGKKRAERKAKTPEQALASLMRLASRGERSSGDALRLMRGWGIDHAAQQKILRTLMDQKFIDDRRYAEAYVREKSGLNGWGAYKIRRMLASKGISGEIAERALAQIGRDESTAKLARMLERKLKTGKDEDTYQLRGRLLRYGMSLGYEYEQVMETVEKLTK